MLGSRCSWSCKVHVIINPCSSVLNVEILPSLVSAVIYIYMKLHPIQSAIFIFWFRTYDKEAIKCNQHRDAGGGNGLDPNHWISAPLGGLKGPDNTRKLEFNFGVCQTPVLKQVNVLFTNAYPSRFSHDSSCFAVIHSFFSNNITFLALFRLFCSLYTLSMPFLIFLHFICFYRSYRLIALLPRLVLQQWRLSIPYGLSLACILGLFQTLR